MVKHALAVDNNPVILRLLKHILEKRNLKVVTAENGLEALEILENFHPDIIFTDLIMPYIGGEKLCRLIRRKKAFTDTPLIIVSAIALEDEIDCTAFGADACIAKGPASQMTANIELVLSLADDQRRDLLTGMRLGAESLVQRAMTSELLAARKHLQAVLEHTDSGILELGKQGKIVACNALALQFFDAAETELLGLHISQLCVGEQSHISDIYDLSQQHNTSVECTRSIRINNRDVLFKVHPLATGATVSSLIVLRDITEEKKARNALKDHLSQLESLVEVRTRELTEANRKLQEGMEQAQKMHAHLELAAKQWRNTFDTITDFVSVHDKNLKFVKVNKALADFLGKPANELVGCYCYQVLHGLDHPWEHCPHQEAMESGKVTTFEVDDPAIGSILEVTCTPFLEADGSLAGTVHVARDISEKKRQAKEKEELIGQLERSLEKVKLLSGFLPICASCKKIRDDQGYWQQVESYIKNHSEAQFSHSICPECVEKLYPGMFDDDD